MSGSLPLSRTIKLQTHYMQMSPFFRNSESIQWTARIFEPHDPPITETYSQGQHLRPMAPNGPLQLGHVNDAPLALNHILLGGSIATLPAYMK